MPRVVSALLLVSCLFLARSPAGHACGPRDIWNPAHPELVAAADLLAAGKSREAVTRVRRSVAGVTESSVPIGDTDLWVHNRARQLLAIAVARSAGAVEIAPGVGGKRPAQRQAAIEWAITAMRGSLTHSSTQLTCKGGACRSIDDPQYTSALAEILALAEDSRDEAYRLLKELSDDDVVPTPQGWAVLAALHRIRGELDAAEQAAGRCRQQAIKGVRCDVTL